MHAVKPKHAWPIQGCSEQIALEGQDLPRTYLLQHELESVFMLLLLLCMADQQQMLGSRHGSAMALATGKAMHNSAVCLKVKWSDKSPDRMPPSIW